jgi:hypothetical protein
MPVESAEKTGAYAAHLRMAEFASLRRAIAGRVTARAVLGAVTSAVWATLTLALVLFSDVPLATLLPLAVLVGGFEAIHVLHAGAERIGRYLQVEYEGTPDGPRWETAAMAVGPSLPGGGVDPLFTGVFVGAAAINLISAFLVLAEPTRAELGLLGLVHAAFAFRVIRARIAAARQRAVELESFKALLGRTG